MKIFIFSLLFINCLFAQNTKMQIFKPVTSICPQDWLDEITKEVNEIDIITLMDVKNLKKDIGIPKEIQSCNTSILDDYVFEGNVPPQAIKVFFKDIPKDALGLSLPSYENNKLEKKVFIIFSNKTYKEFGKYK